MSDLSSLHKELDDLARKYRGHREPLRRDPALWAAFEEDRKRKLSPRLKPGQRCAMKGCDNRLRPRNRTAEDFPGTVPLGGRGMCHHCYKRHRRNPEKWPAPAGR